jgi:TRAP transporter TAXI family solute receptor
LTRRGFLGALGAVALLGVSGCGLRREATPLAMASGESGGTYLQFGALLRDAVSRAGVAELEVRATKGSFDNLDQLVSGQADLGIALADSVASRDDDLVAIGRVYQNYLQCVVRDDSDIVGLADLRGHRVGIGAHGSGAAYTAGLILEVTGLREGDDPVDEVELGIQAASDALVAGEIDALFWSSGIPAPVIAELTASPGVRFVDLTDALPGLEERHPGSYLATALPSGAYGGSAETPTVGTPNYLLARPDLADEIAAGLVDVLISDAERLVPEGSVGVQYLTSANLIDTAPVPLHPAAASRYRHHYG